MFLAASEQASGIGALGLDIKSIVFQIIAFTLVVWILKKFALSKLMVVIDARRDELKAGLDRAEAAKQELAEASRGADVILAEARQQADEITTIAQTEAAEKALSIEKRAQTKAATIDAEAREQLAQETAKVRSELKVEAAKLVADVSSIVLNEKLDSKRDGELIATAINTAAKS